jgi:hypothetical protein
MSTFLRFSSARLRIFVFFVVAISSVSVPPASAEDRLVDQIMIHPSGASRQDVTVELVGASHEERQLVREGAKRAVNLLGQCGLEAPPLIRVMIEKKPLNVCGVDAFGSFDAESQSIRLVNKQTCAKMISVNSAYAGLSFDEFFKSLTVHEMAHVIFRHRLNGRRVSHATHEYVAYAIQIASFPTAERAEFLKLFTREPPTDLSPFVDILYLMSPEHFGVLAYDHFSAPDNGCRILTGIVKGQVEFPVLEELE